MERDARSAEGNGTRQTPKTAGPTRLQAIVERVCAKLPDRPSPGFVSEANELDDVMRLRKNRFVAAVGARYANCTLENFRAELPEQQRVLGAIHSYAKALRENIANGRNVILFGPVGTGKDHLLCGLARCAMEAGKRIEVATGADLFATMRRAVNGNADEYALLESLGEADVLLLSDPAVRRDRITDYQADTLYWLVDRRYRHCRPTWVTLNVDTADEADARLGSPIVDRLQDGALVIRCDWPSYRKTQEVI